MPLTSLPTNASDGPPPLHGVDGSSVFGVGGDCTPNNPSGQNQPQWWTAAESVLPYGVDPQLQRDREILARGQAFIEARTDKSGVRVRELPPYIAARVKAAKARVPA